MKSVASISSIAVACAAGLLSVSFIAVPAQAATMKECAAQWSTMKAAKQTEGKTYKDFSKTCMSGSSDAAKTDAAKPNGMAKDAGAADVKKPDAPKKAAKADAPAKTDTADKKDAKPSEARAAAVARQKECGAEWKADKAAGKVAAGMKWPQYWSACSKRKKGEG
jgi:hypothetical protein